MRSSPLWDDANNTLLSSPFYVKPGWSAVLFAVGLSEEKVRKSAAEFKGPQMICVEKLIYDCKFPEPKPDCCGIICMKMDTGSMRKMQSGMPGNIIRCSGPDR